MPDAPISDIIITNHLGEKKSEIKNLKGVLLKTILQKALLPCESPKQLSEFYFVLTACDGYKVIYSWNELFNTQTGNFTYLVTSKNNIDMGAMNESILVLTTSDFTTGRRYLKGLSSITINRVQ
jgi:hypothetical protein